MSISGIESTITLKSGGNLLNESLSLGEEYNIIINGENVNEAVIADNKQFIILGKIKCTSFTLTLKESTSFDYLFEIKSSKTSIGKVILKNIVLKCIVNIKKKGLYLNFIIFYY